MANGHDRGWIDQQHGDRGRQRGGYTNAEGGFGEPRGEPAPGRMPAQHAQGPHVGKGPKGYRRSDERIREDVGDLLERHPYIDARDIELHVADGVVSLSGTVEDRRTKRLVEDVVETVPGVKDVSNQLRISQGRLDDALNDFSASGTTMGRGTTGAGGPVPPRRQAPAEREPRPRKR